MRTWARWTAKAAMVTASFVAAGAGSVGIASAGTTSGNGSILGGNQISVPISIPVSVCGNAVALLGGSFAACEGGASVSRHGDDDGSAATTSGNHSILGGNQVSAPVSVPVSVCGNAVAVLGHALAACKGGASVSRHGDDDGSAATTSGNHSVGGGNQVSAPVKAPVNVCANSVNSKIWCPGGAFVHTAGLTSWSGGPTTSGNGSILGGNQIGIPVSVPVSICGNAVAVLGGAAAGCEGGAWTGAPASWDASGPAHLLAYRTAGAASALNAGTTAAPGMGSGSLFALALGALLAGAATLTAAGRRLSIRKAGR